MCKKDRFHEKLLDHFRQNYSPFPFLSPHEQQRDGSVFLPDEKPVLIRQYYDHLMDLHIQNLAQQIDC